ncbi:hypothetical protein ADL29_21510 [Streptomyces chattanoogensis]|uniref:Uncharacterized protein n=1 Tax=Streptomyces chattanoogensis TaxID=66876 RepID=A0A0N0GYN3_9ACTN|nr:hypothetical protein ADL29_21510 [Streptomyces chattanoogensis]
MLSEPGPDDEVVQGVAGPGGVRQRGRGLGGVQPGVQRLDVRTQPRRVHHLPRRAVLRRFLGRDQLRYVGGRGQLADQGGQMGLDPAVVHQVDAGEQDPQRVQQRLQLAGLLEQPPLGRGEAAVVVGVVRGEQVRGERDQLLVDLGGVHDQG